MEFLQRNKCSVLRYIVGFVVVLMISYSYCGLPKISITGEAILQESSEGSYIVKVENTARKDLSNITVIVDNFCNSCLKCCSILSDDFQIQERDTINEPIRGFLKCLPRGGFAAMTIRFKADPLEKFGMLKSDVINATVFAYRTKKRATQKSVTTFQSKAPKNCNLRLFFGIGVPVCTIALYKIYKDYFCDM